MAVGQNSIGLPDIINYSKQAYKAGLQNWDFKQDKNGVLYVANNEGLLSYDGRFWKLYPLPNKTIVRSVEIANDQKIYVGGQDELGFFAPNANGKLQYQSLTNKISRNDIIFGDVWDIVVLNKDIFFRTPNKIFRYSNGTMAAFDAANEWSFLAICKGQIYAQDKGTGLMLFNNEVFTPVLTADQLAKNDPITALLPLNGDTLLMTTLRNGLHYLINNKLQAIASANNVLFKSERIYAATKINENRIALATSTNGVYVVNNKGTITQQFSKEEGLQNKNVLSIFVDRQQHLWLGLDNGIDLIAYNSAIKQINPQQQDASGYTALIYDNRLYAGTSVGLFAVTLQPMDDLSFSLGRFDFINNTKGQVWHLSNINNQLLMGHHDGAFRIDKNSAQPIASPQGSWNFVPMGNVFPAKQLLMGHYNGISVFDYNSSGFVLQQNIPNFNESSRFVAIDQQNNTWVSHPYHGVYKITHQPNTAFSTKAYNQQHGLPSTLNNHVFKIKNEVIVATEKGIYRYDSEKDQFVMSSYYKNLLGTQSIRYVKEDAVGNIWFVHDKTLGVIDLSGKVAQTIYLPELSSKLLSGFEFMYPVNDQNIFLGAEKGFIHINFEKYKKNVPPLQVQVRQVRIVDQTDSLLFGGYFDQVNEPPTQASAAVPTIKNHWKTIRFEFSAPLFAYQSNIEYSYRLKGFDNEWSEYNSRTEKEYTKLPAGNYSFEVKVRNNLLQESATAIYRFTVLPPWYASTWAYVLYLTIFFFGLWYTYRWLKKKFRLQQNRFQHEQNRLLYIHDLERSKNESEMVTLRNEKLEAEINHKNSELASAAMHLVKKGELLTKLKGELSQIMKGVENPQAISDVKKLIRTLSEDDNIDKEWENFTKHFDKVHSDFVVNLKETHPSLTGNEIKLCTYLRMNLSTKEIAQLMNISVRGVEISRYRLRKKLQLPSEVNLFDYLISLQKDK
jgi:ligand-binding sensor domain-containing protein/DNA-binding CsgD family transcriptional regulator